MFRLTARDVERDFSAVLESVVNDDAEFLIERDGRPVARIVPLHEVEADRIVNGLGRRRSDQKIRVAMAAAVNASRWVNHSRSRA